MSTGVLSLLIGVPVALFAVLMQSMVFVPSGRVMIIERFGKYHRTLTPGLHGRLPAIERPRAVVDLSPAITKAAVVVLRSVLGTVTVDSLSRQGSRASWQLRAQLENIVSQFGASVLEFEILDPGPRSAALSDSEPHDSPSADRRPAASSADRRPVDSPQGESTHGGFWDAPDVLST
jgi:regulator of protease activity HflC (stomatin/prohibitin superfamily)